MTRSAAAKQLGEVQRLHPHELNTLLSRITTYLRSNTWETRIAAAEAVRAIVNNVPQWKPQGVLDDQHSHSISCVGRLRLDQFDMQKVLENSTYLMASEGKEFDTDDDLLQGVELKERLAKQRQQLNERLGLQVAASLGLDTSGLFTNQDLVTNEKKEPESDGCRVNSP